MNTITVADIMNLDIMKGCRLAAGASGLTKEVRYINVYDNPVSDADRDIKIFPGEIYLTFFYHGRNNPDYLNLTLDLLISRNVAALIVFDEYFKEMPEDFTARCDRAEIPLIFMDCKTPYSLIISGIIEYRVHAEQKKNIEDKLTAIVSSRTSPEEKMQLTSELNPGFQNNVIALFAMEPESSEKYFSPEQSRSAQILNLCSTISRDSRYFAAEYRDGVLVVLSYSDSRLPERHRSLENTIQIIQKYLPQASVGVSNLCPLSALGTAVSQSYTALRADRITAKRVSYYSNLGLTRILLELSKTPAVEEFFRDIITPIQKYDRENNGQLFQTMLTFTANNMDYKKTAACMFVHENTIRYRIGKIKELIPYGISEIDFYETLSVTSKIYRLKQF